MFDKELVRIRIENIIRQLYCGSVVTLRSVCIYILMVRGGLAICIFFLKLRASLWWGFRIRR
jgi:hypothetical protein